MADENKKSRCASCWDWIGSPTFYIYLNFFLGAWGDRMWMFSVGMYLVTLAGGVLRLAAVYSLAGSCSFLLFGGILGDWVDKNGRLKVVRITLVIQNVSVMLSAVAVSLALIFTGEIYSSTVLKVVTEAAIIVFAVLAQLASMTYHIAIEKDWIVTVATGDKSSLANLNAVIRSIDLTCKILAPTVCGFIMYYASMFTSALVIVGWNIVSVFMEYALLTKVYRMVPELAIKGKKDFDRDEKSEDDGGSIEEKAQLTSKSEGKSGSEEAVTEETKLNGSTDTKTKGEGEEKSTELEMKKSKSCVGLMMEPFVTLVRSWKIYSKQSVVFAGLSLSFLYMTVLGFDCITVGFIYYNGVNESITGLSMALAGVFGIIGAFAYTRFRKMIGLERTGLLSFGFEISCLALCVVAVFAPGSLFDHDFNPWGNSSTCAVTDPTISPMTNLTLDVSPGDNDTHAIVKRDLQRILVREAQQYFIGEPNAEMMSLSNILSASESNGFPNFGFLNGDDMFRQGTNSFPNTPAYPNNRKMSRHTVNKRYVVEEKQKIHAAASNNLCRSPKKYNGFNYSIVLLLIGIVTSRIGLWMSDLVITQTLQENVAENERGTVNGIQGSLNMMMDILKNVLVIVVPHIQTFGYLIMLSFLFICAGGCLFCVHSYRVRGHLFHCRRVWCYCCYKNRQGQATENGTVGSNGPARAIEDIETVVV